MVGAIEKYDGVHRDQKLEPERSDPRRHSLEAARGHMMDAGGRNARAGLINYTMLTNDLDEDRRCHRHRFYLILFCWCLFDSSIQKKNPTVRRSGQSLLNYNCRLPLDFCPSSAAHPYPIDAQAKPTSSKVPSATQRCHLSELSHFTLVRRTQRESIPI
jgi:hypothetical protein